MYSTNSPDEVMSRSQRLEKVWVLARRNLSLYISQGMIFFCEVAVAFSQGWGSARSGGLPPRPPPIPEEAATPSHRGMGFWGERSPPF